MEFDLETRTKPGWGEDFYVHMGVYARNYLALQKLRMATDARLRKFRDDGADKGIMSIQIQHRQTLYRDEKKSLNAANEVMKDHPLWAWCEGVRGMGPVAGLVLIGFLSPYKSTTAGHARAYVGLLPDKSDDKKCMALKSGEKSNFNPLAKARVLMIAKSVIMAKDPYYYPLYRRKKDYYMMERGMGAYIDSPQLCPRYEECSAKLLGAAKREKRGVKKPGCKGHIDAMATRWLAQLIVSHAMEIMRDAEGFDIQVFKIHREYIAPPGVV